jgi:hypothetical protein
MVTMTATAAEAPRHPGAGRIFRRACAFAQSRRLSHQYDMVFDDEQTGDQRFESNGMALVVDADSLPS